MTNKSLRDYINLIESAEKGVVDTIKKGAKKAWDYATEPIHQTHDIIAKDRAKNIAKIRKNREQGVEEGSNDTIYPNAEVIKSKNGKPIGEIYQDESGWGAFHYKADNGADGMGDREEALAQLKDMHNERRQQGVAEGNVVQFPKKHRGDITDMHECPKCGGDLQGGKYQGHEVQVCMPCKQVYLPPNSGIDQKGNKIKEQGVAEGKK